MVSMVSCLCDVPGEATRQDSRRNLRPEYPVRWLVALLGHFGFALRTAGSHHIFSREGVNEILNLQPRRDGTAKPYQVKQVRQMITRYRLTGEDNAI